MFGALFLSDLQAQQSTKEKMHFEDSISSELKKYPTTTHFIYEIINDSKFNFHNIDTLEKIISNVELKLPKKQKYSQEEVIEILSSVGSEISSFGLKYKKNKFDCNDFSFIYLAVGEKFGIPLYGVNAPEHLFVKYDIDGKHNSISPKDSVNKGDFNWETTGAFISSDNLYIDLYSISKELIDKGIFMKNLTKLELIALAYDINGFSLDKLGKYELAIKTYDLAIKLNPDNADFYSNKGVSLKNLGKYELAIENYNLAINLNPNNAIFYSNKGVSLDKLGKYELAIENYNLAIKLNPNEADFYSNKGNSLARKGEYELAIENYNLAIKLNPDNADFYYNKKIVEKY